jgi:hypothetical protein
VQISLSSICTGYLQRYTKNYFQYLIMAILLNYIIGSLTILIALYHFRLYKIRNLHEYLKDIAPFVQRIICTINLALAILFLLIGILTILYSKELSTGKGLSLGFNICLLCFWSWRFIWGRLYPISHDENSKLKIVKNSIGPVLIGLYLLLISTTMNQ